MTLTIPKILIIGAAICFGVTALGLASLVALGLTLWAVAAVLS